MSGIKFSVIGELPYESYQEIIKAMVKLGYEMVTVTAYETHCETIPLPPE